MRRLLLSSSVALATLILTGCANNDMAISLYELKKEEIKLSSNIGELKKGVLVFENGEKLLDEDGDIISSFTINNELFYIVKSYIKDDSHFKIKNKENEIISEIKANKIIFFRDDNKFILGVQLEKNRNKNIFDNIYDFNGRELKLIGKNLDFSNGIYEDDDGETYADRHVDISGIYMIEHLYQYIGNYKVLYKTNITNILTSKKVEFSKVKPNYEASKKPVILGIRNDIVFYAYPSGSFFSLSLPKKIIEAYDINNDKKYTLFSDTDSDGISKKIQLLKHNNDVVLKIFDNPEIKSEIIFDTYDVDNNSKYINEPAKMIHLNSLKEIDGISSSFSIIPVYTTLNNISGSNVKRTFLTFPSLYLMETRINQEPLF